MFGTENYAVIRLGFIAYKSADEMASISFEFHSISVYSPTAQISSTDDF